MFFSLEELLRASSLIGGDYDDAHAPIAHELKLIGKVLKYSQGALLGVIFAPVFWTQLRLRRIHQQLQMNEVRTFACPFVPLALVGRAGPCLVLPRPATIATKPPPP